MIYVMFFAVVLAIAVTLLPADETRPLIHFFEALFKVSIPFIIVVLTTSGVNPSLIALILGVDRILDMCRTTLNVMGDRIRESSRLKLNRN